MKSRWTIGKKLTISCAATLALMIVMSVGSLNSIGNLNTELENATRGTARRIQLGGIMDVAGSDMLAGQRGLLLFTYAKDPAKSEAARKLFHTAADRWQKALDEA